MVSLRSALAGLLAVATLLAPASTALAQGLDQDAFEQRLREAQSQTDEAMEHYEDGDAEAALEDARAVRDRFTFEGNGSSPLEDAIREASALSIADRVKALASRFASAIDSGEPVDQVREVHRDLGPSLNRLVLVSQGENAPASQRDLKTEEAIREGVDEVRSLVDESVDLHAAGDTEAAVTTAEEAFFTFETNGVGPDTAAVDEPLENEVENRIQNFNTSSDELGLVGLIENGSSLEEVRSHAEHVHEGLDQVEELLIATKPPSNLGDANRNGEVTIVDALLTAQAALGVQASEPPMDANQDGQVTIVDALLIAQAALGITTL